MLGRSVVAILVFAALTATVAHPLIRTSEVLPGLGPGDNLAFLWNTWWFGEAFGGRETPFRTDAPQGCGKGDAQLALAWNRNRGADVWTADGAAPGGPEPGCLVG